MSSTNRFNLTPEQEFQNQITNLENVQTGLINSIGTPAFAMIKNTSSFTLPADQTIMISGFSDGVKLNIDTNQSSVIITNSGIYNISISSSFSSSKYIRVGIRIIINFTEVAVCYQTLTGLEFSSNSIQTMNNLSTGDIITVEIQNLSPIESEITNVNFNLLITKLIS